MTGIAGAAAIGIAMTAGAGAMTATGITTPTAAAAIGTTTATTIANPAPPLREVHRKAGPPTCSGQVRTHRGPSCSGEPAHTARVNLTAEKFRAGRRARDQAAQ